MNLCLTRTRLALLAAVRDGEVYWDRRAFRAGDYWGGRRVSARICELQESGLVRLRGDVLALRRPWELTRFGAAAVDAQPGTLTSDLRPGAAS